MSGYTKILCALLAVLVTSHGTSAKPVHVEQLPVADNVPPVPSDFDPGYTTCVFAVYPEGKKLYKEATDIAKTLRSLVDGFENELKMCSRMVPAFVDVVGCKGGVMMRYGQLLNTFGYNIGSAMQQGNELSAKMTKCLEQWREEQTEPPQKQPAHTKAF